MQPQPAPTPEEPMNITLDQINAALSYDKETGGFTWIKPTGRRAKPGDVAGSVWPSGYLAIGVCGQRILAHRLAWFIETGEWPKFDIDHINGNPLDNRIANLRPASRSQNMANTPKRASNTSGVKGVHWSSRSRRWIARVMKDGKQIHLGAFTDISDAAKAYAAGASVAFGEFARAA